MPPATTRLLILIALYAVGGAFWARKLGVGEDFTFNLYSMWMVKVTVLLFLLFTGWRVYSLILFQRPQHLTRTLIADIRQRLFTREKLIAAIPIFLGFMVFISVFTSLKSLIPLTQRYVWDAEFAALDRFLHFGVDPWRLLQPVLGHAWVTSFLNIIYNLWFVVMFAVLYWQLFDLRRPALRMRFFWTFFLCWMINGTVLAMTFSSAGPCFYHYLVMGPDPFAEQMDYLRALAENYPVWAVKTQDGLWETYRNNAVGLGSGISAMPSVHVAIACLMFLLSWHYNKAARWALGLFALAIMLGSVHLAWHYAVDGYVGAAVALVIWGITGRYIREKP